MPARIYRPARSAMSSGQGKTDHWVLEYTHADRRDIDPLMGWISSADTQAQVMLSFDSKEEALAYATEKGIDATVIDPQPRRPNIRPGGYSENFATSRRGPWTH